MQRQAQKEEIKLRTNNPEEMSILVRIIVRGMLPLVLIFGIYIISYGNLTPGGGFQGGMILVGAVMAFYLAFGYHSMARFRDEGLELIESGAIMLFLIIGLVGLFGRGFMDNLLRGGIPGTLLSGGNVLILNFVVGLKVAAGTLLVIVILLETLHKGED